MRLSRLSTTLPIVSALLVTSLITGCMGLDGSTSDGVGTDSENGSGGSPGGGQSVSNKVYYVSNDGDDSADGLSADSSFKTLSRASEVVIAGDTIEILPGVYAGRLMLATCWRTTRARATTTVFTSGTSGRPISHRRIFYASRETSSQETHG